MKLNVILTVFRKEILDLLRDRRTLLSMVVLPIVVFPLLFSVMGKFMGEAGKKAESEATTVAIVADQIPSGFNSAIARSGLSIVVVQDVASAVESKKAACGQCWCRAGADAPAATARAPASHSQRPHDAVARHTTSMAVMPCKTPK